MATKLAGMTGYPSFAENDAQASTRPVGAAELLLEFSGSLTKRDHSALLADFFINIQTVMEREQRKVLKLDLRQLSYMNSIGFKHFVTWLTNHAPGDVAKRYKIQFVVNPKYHWQAVSIHALCAFSRGKAAIIATMSGSFSPS